MRVGDKIKVNNSLITTITTIKWSIKYNCNLIYFLNEDGVTAYEMERNVVVVEDKYEEALKKGFEAGRGLTQDGWEQSDWEAFENIQR